MKLVIEITEEALTEDEKRELARQFACDTPAPEDGGFLELTDDIGRTLYVKILGEARDLNDPDGDMPQVFIWPVDA